MVGGIALVAGPAARVQLLQPMLAALEPADGETRQVSGPELVAAMRYPAGTGAGTDPAGPLAAPDGRWVLCCTARLDNLAELHAGLAAEGRSPETGGAAAAVLAAFLAWGEDAVLRLRGDFAFALADQACGSVYLARDPLGARSLYWSQDGPVLRVASQVKALVPAGQPVREVPPGQHGWAETGAGCDLVPYADYGWADGPVPSAQYPATPPAARLGAGITTVVAGDAPVTDPGEACERVRNALWAATSPRVMSSGPVGVALTGGLDDAIVAALAREARPGCVAVTVGAPGSEDVAVARRLAADLGLPHEVIELRPGDLGPDDAREAIRLCELTEYGDIVNAMIFLPVLRRARDLGLTAMLTGDGGAELFGGYPMYHRAGPDAARLLAHRLRQLGRTELQRLDRAAVATGVETRMPFLDREVARLGLRIPLELKVRDGYGQWILRQAFAGLLPGYLLGRQRSLAHASGLHERARLYRPLFGRMYRSFGYDLLEPLRRDFSVLLRQADGDLDQALAGDAARRDYSALEHARDLAGAVRHRIPLTRSAAEPLPAR
jgi:asparagine synthase (glutamine-hydrolysing)